jgi:hypothetical protein
MKNIRNKFLILIVISVTGLTSCDFSDGKLIVDNQTTDSIAFIILNESNYYPTYSEDTSTNEAKLKDTALINSFVKCDPGSESKGGIHFLSPKSAKHLSTFNTKWKYLVESNPNKQLQILFVPANFMTTGKFKWKDLYQKNIFDKRTFTIDELNNNDWKVVYSK